MNGGPAPVCALLHPWMGLQVLQSMQLLTGGLYASSFTSLPLSSLVLQLPSLAPFFFFFLNED